ncbi:MAG: FIST C-terminal domain-containing protein [Treponema sp.]|jgi:hypothetical protein|nr:FIST C-terminal domain-containing protein [Treponema sp.]
MMRMLSAGTFSIDDPDAAVDEILKGLALDSEPPENAVGIIACNYEYIDNGTVAALSRRLPFDTAGCTTLGSGTAGKCGQELLSVAVLTGAEFSTVLSGPLESETASAVSAAACRRASAGREEKPSLILAYMPMIGLGIHSIYEGIAEAAGTVPVFGLLACDQTLKYGETKVIMNGEGFRDRLVLVLVYGALGLSFFTAAMPWKNIQKQHAIITESEGCLLKRVNGMLLLDYLATLGLTKDGGIEATGSIPFLVNYNDGSKPAARALYTITPEGYAVCGGEMPVNAAITIGSLDYGSIMESAGTASMEAVKAGNINGIFVYPCVSRSLMLGPNGDDEMRRAMEIFGDIPYQICYGAGEICPLNGGERGWINYLHSFSFAVCAF